MPSANSFGDRGSRLPSEKQWIQIHHTTDVHYLGWEWRRQRLLNSSWRPSANAQTESSPQSLGWWYENLGLSSYLVLVLPSKSNNIQFNTWHVPIFFESGNQEITSYWSGLLIWTVEQRLGATDLWVLHDGPSVALQTANPDEVRPIHTHKWYARALLLMTISVESGSRSYSTTLAKAFWNQGASNLCSYCDASLQPLLTASALGLVPQRCWRGDAYPPNVASPQALLSNQVKGTPSLHVVVSLESISEYIACWCRVQKTSMIPPPKKSCQRSHHKVSSVPWLCFGMYLREHSCPQNANPFATQWTAANSTKTMPERIEMSSWPCILENSSPESHGSRHLCL